MNEKMSLTEPVVLNCDFDAALDIVKSSFKDHGFGVLSEIDIAKALKEKIGENIERYTILGMCNPQLSFEAISAEPEIGLLLPCNVLVRGGDGAVNIYVQNPELMSQLADNFSLVSVATEASVRLRAALVAVKQANVPAPA